MECKEDKKIASFTILVLVVVVEVGRLQRNWKSWCRRCQRRVVLSKDSVIPFFLKTILLSLTFRSGLTVPLISGGEFWSKTSRGRFYGFRKAFSDKKKKWSSTCERHWQKYWHSILTLLKLCNKTDELRDGLARSLWMS